VNYYSGVKKGKKIEKKRSVKGIRKYFLNYKKEYV